jgi:transcriptional regulator with XRE-family HTH domain
MRCRLNEAMKELRKVIGITQRELAALIGASKDTVASWETGRDRVSAGMARRIALATGVDDRSLLRGSRPLLTYHPARRPFTREEFERHQKQFWGGTAEESVRRHLPRCLDALELLLRAAGQSGEGGIPARMAGVLDSFIQWCQETRKDFRLEKAIDAQLGERKATLELNKSYGQWREMARTDPTMARMMGFRDDPKRGDSEMLRLSMETVPVWMPGHSMRGGRARKRWSDGVMESRSGGLG